MKSCLWPGGMRAEKTIRRANGLGVCDTNAKNKCRNFYNQVSGSELNRVPKPKSRSSMNIYIGIKTKNVNTYGDMNVTSPGRRVSDPHRAE